MVSLHAPNGLIWGCGGGGAAEGFYCDPLILFSTISVGNTDAAGEMGASGPHAGSLCL